MSKPTYYELLQSPLWQKKRLEIMERDGFKCRDCGSEERTLHVHHVRYIKGRMPWDYSGHLLLTVCDECHEARQRVQDAILEPTGGLTIEEMRQVAGYACAMLCIKKGKTEKDIDRDRLGESYMAGFIAAGWPHG